LSADKLEFAIFCIENVAARLGVSGQRAYDLLASGDNLLDSYIVKHYDALHTQDKDYIVDDVLAVLGKEAARA
jgi:hypothetical protein